MYYRHISQECDCSSIIYKRQQPIKENKIVDLDVGVCDGKKILLADKMQGYNELGLILKINDNILINHHNFYDMSMSCHNQNKS